jgi:hypothetical protein
MKKVIILNILLRSNLEPNQERLKCLVQSGRNFAQVVKNPNIFIEDHGQCSMLLSLAGLTYDKPKWCARKKVEPEIGFV